MIAVVGSANMDLVARAPHIPKPGETVLGGGFAESPGGKGANQAMAIARLGSSAAFVASVGEDAHGDALLAGFVRAGMDVRFVARCATARTGVALIVVDEGGQNAIVVAPGANAELTPSFVRASVELLAPQVLLAQLEVPLATVEAAFAAAPKALKILNPAPAQDLPAGLLAATDVIVPNETETEVLTGILPDTDQNCRRAADALRAKGVGTVVITLGARGCYTFDGSQEMRLPAAEVEVVDTTAAGDAFCGALALAFQQRKSLSQALSFATAVAGLSVSRAGAQASMPSWAEVKNLVDHNW